MSWPSPRSQAYKLSHDGAALSTHTQPAGTKGHHPLPPEGQPGKQWSFLSGSRRHRGGGPPFLGCVTRCHHKSFWGSVLAAGDLPGQSVFASCGHFTHAVLGPFSKYSHTGTHLVHEQRDLGRSSHKMLFFILVTDFPWKCVP